MKRPLNTEAALDPVPLRDLQLGVAAIGRPGRHSPRRDPLHGVDRRIEIRGRHSLEANDGVGVPPRTHQLQPTSPPGAIPCAWRFRIGSPLPVPLYRGRQSDTMAGPLAATYDANWTRERHATRSSGARQARAAPWSRVIRSCSDGELQPVSVALHRAVFDFFGNHAERKRLAHL